MPQTNFVASNAFPNQHIWHFFRAGGFNQVRIDNAADLLMLDQLDQKLWVALSCPTRGIEFNSKTLDWIDSDHDGHIRAVEIIAATKWAGAMLKNPDLLLKKTAEIPLSAINDESTEGLNLLSAARYILQCAGKPDAESISLADTEEAQKHIAAMRFNGDGILPVEAIEDAELKIVAKEIMSCCGSQQDRSGEPGISANILDQFFTEVQAYISWWLRAEQDRDRILFLGEASLDAASSFHTIYAKVTDYFTRCNMAAFDPRACSPLNRSVDDYQMLSNQNLDSHSAAISAFPLATVEACKPLPLHNGLNPAWRSTVNTFYHTVIHPLFGHKDTLTEEEWNSLCTRFAALENWLADKPTQGSGVAAELRQLNVDQLGIERCRKIIDSGFYTDFMKLIEQDCAVSSHVNTIASVEKLLLYCRDLYSLVNNFVSFGNFYRNCGKAMFQAGTLFLDGRSCELCVRIEEVNKHAALANLSRLCLAYCECTREGGKEKMFIAAAFTAGDSDQLMVGRNGVFYDRKGLDWNATIIRILEHPISIRQSFLAPYKRVSKMLGEQLQKLATAKSQAAEQKMFNTVMDSSNKGVATKSSPPPFDVAKFAGIFAALGLAVGAIGTAAAAVLTGLMSLKFWQIPLAFAGILLMISGPSMLIAWFKLRQRNLGPILDANGWAVNARAKINVPFGTSLTKTARLPEGADHSLIDPFAEKKQVWPQYLGSVLLAFIVIWCLWRAGLFGQ